jgi:hypothetical protein
LLRSELDVLESSPKSFMPEGLESQLQPQDLADIFGYLKQVGTHAAATTQSGRFAREIVQATDGSLMLLAPACEIYGKSLSLESEDDANLGNWNSQDDCAVWPIRVVKGGDFAVWIDSASDGSNSATLLSIECGDGKLDAHVPTTADWNTYGHVIIGSIKVAEGAQRLSVRSKGAFNGELLKLKSLQLVPAQDP